MNKKPILSVRNLEISFSQYTKGLRRIDSKAINNLDKIGRASCRERV